MTANTHTISTAPAATSFMYLIVECCSLVVRSHNFSSAEFNISKATTRLMLKAIHNHSCFEILKYRDVAITAKAIIACNFKCVSRLNDCAIPAKANPNARILFLR